MTRAELYEAVRRYSNEIVRLFTAKNDYYGDDQAGFYNFTTTAERVWGTGDLQTAFRVLLTYMDKHVVALANVGLGGDARERLLDIAVYALIGMAMADEAERCGEAEFTD